MSLTKRGIERAFSNAKAIRWWVGVCDYTTDIQPTRPPAPWLIGGAAVHALSYNPDNDSIFVVEHARHTVIEISRDRRILWEYGTYGSPGPLDTPRSAEYVPELCAVLIADKGRVLLVDYKTKKVRYEIKDIQGEGPLGDYVTAAYDPYWGEPIICDRYNYAVYHTTWEGRVQYSLGTRGERGKTSTLLYDPMFASVQSNAPHFIWVAERDADWIRAFRRGTGETARVIPMRRPTWVKFYKNLSWMLTGSVFDVSPIFEVPDGSPHTWFPEGVRCAVLTDNFTVIAARHRMVFEVDLRDWWPYGCPRNKPVKEAVLFDYPLSADTSTDYFHFLGLGYKRAIIQALSTQTATLEIYAIRLEERGTMTYSLPLNYDDYIDPITLTANELHTEILGDPPLAFAVRLTMGSTDGNVWLWVDRR